jgi:hypothetical protein
MLIPTEGLIEDGFSFLLLVAVLAFFWFHGWHRGGRATGAEPAEPHKKAA